MGYHRAGFEVVGVDLEPQPRYPFEFIQADALTLDRDYLASFDAIHVSPACQGYTDLRHAPGAVGAARTIPAFRAMLIPSGRPYVIENVEGARSALRQPTLLCGSMFGLGHSIEGIDTAYLRRHRLFETSFPVHQRRCHHQTDAPVIGVYGGHVRTRAQSWGGRKTRDNWDFMGGHRPAAAEAMGIDWMTLAEMSEAIPPAYTQFIGAQLLAHLEQREAA